MSPTSKIIISFFCFCSVLVAMPMFEERGQPEQRNPQEIPLDQGRRGEVSELQNSSPANSEDPVDASENHQQPCGKITMDPTSNLEVKNSAGFNQLAKASGENASAAERPSAIGSWTGGTTIEQVPASDKPLNKLASLLTSDNKDIQQHILTFFFRDPEASQKETISQGDQLLEKLKKNNLNLPKSINLPESIDAWRKLSPESQAELEQNLPPGSLESIKGIAIAAELFERTNSFQKAAILDASNAENRIERQSYFLAAPLRAGAEAANRNIEEIDFAIEKILDLSNRRGDWLRKTDPTFHQAAVKAKEAIEKLQKFAEIKTEPMNEADRAEALQCYREGCSLKNEALQQEARNFTAECIERLRQARVSCNANPRDAELSKQLEILIENSENACTCIRNAVNEFTEATETRVTGNEKQAQALEKKAEYKLLAAQAYAIGTPENLKQAANLKEASYSAGDSAYSFYQAAKERVEKAAQALEKEAEYHLKAAQALAIKTPESLEQIVNLGSASTLASYAADTFNRAATARVTGNEKQAQALELSAEYKLQAAQAYAIGTRKSLKKAANLDNAYSYALKAAGEIEKHTNKAIEADKRSNAAQAERHREAAAFILDQLQKFGWIPEDREKRFKKIFHQAEEIANPSSCVVM